MHDRHWQKRERRGPGKLKRWFFVSLASVAILWAILKGYTLDWTGFGASTAKDGDVAAKTLWDWLELILVPVFLALGAWFLETSRKKSEERTEADRQRQAILDSYLASMNKLLLENKLDRSAENESARAVARTSTLAALRAIDSGRKAQLLQFLYEAGLIGENPIVQLNGADLRGADLEHAVLREAELRGVYFTNAILRDAILCHGIFCGSDFANTEVVGADFSETDLRQANFRGSTITAVQLASAAEIADVAADIVPPDRQN
jgi:hypothetical protein